MAYLHTQEVVGPSPVAFALSPAEGIFTDTLSCIRLSPRCISSRSGRPSSYGYCPPRLLCALPFALSFLQHTMASSGLNAYPGPAELSVCYRLRQSLAGARAQPRIMPFNALK